MDSKGFLLKSFPIFIILGFLLLLTVRNPLLVKGENQIQLKPTTSSEEHSNTNQGENSVKVKVNDSVQGVTSNTTTSTDSNSNSESTTTNDNGTCTVTKNGVTETMPADKVDVVAHGTGDQKVDVKCDNNYSSSSNNTTSIKNNVHIDVNSSNNP